MKYLIALILLIAPTVSFAYEPTQTHAGLTEQVVEFYNTNADKKITNSQKELIIQGAMDEDDPTTRAVNHFYDPIRNIGIEGGRTAKDWALGDLVTNDFSWKKAIDAYARGDMNTAFTALGHNMHLVEDMGVPDHTRNDQHLPFLSDGLGGGSPFEDWAKSNKNRATMSGFADGLLSTGAQTRLFPQLGDYFDFLANYSNKNFFSRDTIFRQDVYLEPQISSSDFYYGYVKDGITGETVKLIKRIERKNDVMFTISDGKDFSVLSSYFSRLAPQIIASGAGIVDLFFKEGEKARAQYLADLAQKQQAEVQANITLAQNLSNKGFLGLVGAGAGFLIKDNILTPLKNNIIAPVGSSLSFVGNWIFQETPVAVNVGQFAASTVGETVALGAQIAMQKASNGITIIQQTAVDLLNAPVNPQRQLVGPLFASGAGVNILNTNNLPPQTVLTFDPKVSSSSNSTSSTLVFLGSFSNNLGSQVLGTQTSVSGSGQAVSTGSPVATFKAPTLSVQQCLQTLASDGCLLATTTVRFEWPAVSGATEYLINKNGTTATTTETSQTSTIPDFSDYTFEVVAIDTTGKTTATSTQKVTVASIPVAINEIAWMGTVASANDEWFEIKNNTSYSIDLSQWALDAKGGTPHVKLSGVINPNSYLVFERTSDATIADISAHQIYTGALGNAGEELSLSFASTTIDQTPAGVWSAGENSTSTKRSMERISSKTSGTNGANWQTNNGVTKNGADATGNAIQGTPGAENSTLIAQNGATTTPPVVAPNDPTEPFATLRPSDLNANGIPDAEEAEVVASSTATLLPGEYHFHNLTLTNNAIVYLGGENSGATSTDFLGVKIVADNITLDLGTAFSADRKGYFPAGAKGPGSPALSDPLGGANYGGMNGIMGTSLAYGSATHPVDIGSANGPCCNAGYNGGGAIRLVVKGNFVNNGSVSSAGGASASGGSVYVTTKNLSGAGGFSAGGGQAAVTSVFYRSGAGGRVAVYYENSSFSGSARAPGGCISYDGWTMTCVDAGTVGFFDTKNNDFSTNSSWRFQKNDGLFKFNRVILNGASVTLEDGATLFANEITARNSILVSAKNASITTPKFTVDGGTAVLSGKETFTVEELSILGTGVLTVAPEHTLALSVNNLTIESGAAISVNAKGYGTGFGAGIPLANPLAGASYGGVGAWAEVSSTYGSLREPVDFGSGGNGYHTRGGGALRLIVLGTLVNDGSISANGENTSSGGSVYVTTDTLSGSGGFSALGGTFYWPNVTYGGGGGGRIAVYYKNSTFTGGASSGGSSSSYGVSGAGTVVMEQVGIPPVVPAPTATSTPPLLSSGRAITLFDFALASSTISGIIDETAHTISLAVPFGSDVRALFPTITTSLSAISSPAPGVAQDFSNPVMYIVTAEDGSIQTYTVTVTFLPDTTLPVISSYLFNGKAEDIAVDFATTTPSVELSLTANKEVDWVSVIIENQASSTLRKTFLSGTGCVDGAVSCVKVWNGVLSNGEKVEVGELYRIKVHVKDLLGNIYNDYLSPYIINVI